MTIKVFNHKAVPMTPENEAVYSELMAENKRLDAELAEVKHMLTDDERKAANALALGAGLLMREVQDVGKACLRLDAELAAKTAEYAASLAARDAELAECRKRLADAEEFLGLAHCHVCGKGYGELPCDAPEHTENWVFLNEDSVKSYLRQEARP